MTAPRPVIPGSFLFITRRCTQRQFLLRPDDETNNAFTYCLGEAAQRTGIDVVLAQMMSNHHHTAAYDPNGTQVEFRERFHKLIAKSQNALRGRNENLWAAEEPCVVEVLSADDLLEKLVYIATNPVKDGLVEKVHHWPGPNFVSALLNHKRVKAKRPRHFFCKDGTMPDTVEFDLKLPDHFPHKEQFLAELGRRIAAAEAAHAAERRAKGREVLGRRRVLRQSWRDSPSTESSRDGIRPRVAARNKWARIAKLGFDKVWAAQYRDAFQKLRSGLPAIFPYGTYQLKRLANVAVHPPTTCNVVTSLSSRYSLPI